MKLLLFELHLGRAELSLYALSPYYSEHHEMEDSFKREVIYYSKWHQFRPKHSAKPLNKLKDIYRLATLHLSSWKCSTYPVNSQAKMQKNVSGFVLL